MFSRSAMGFPRRGKLFPVQGKILRRVKPVGKLKVFPICDGAFPLEIVFPVLRLVIPSFFSFCDKGLVGVVGGTGPTPKDVPVVNRPGLWALAGLRHALLGGPRCFHRCSCMDPAWASRVQCTVSSVLSSRISSSSGACPAPALIPFLVAVSL